MKLGRWHSVNLLPFGSLMLTCDDDGRDDGSFLELGWLGYLVHLHLPFLELSRGRSVGPWGPAWSRRRRHWYFPHVDSWKSEDQ